MTYIRQKKKAKVFLLNSPFWPDELYCITRRRSIVQMKIFDVPFSSGDAALMPLRPNHDGYFRVTEQVPELKERILSAQQNREEISFTFDKKLNILKVSSGPR